MHLCTDGWTVPGPGNACFAPRVFSWQAGWTSEFHPTHRYSLLVELALLRGSCLFPAEIVSRRCVTSVNRSSFLHPDGGLRRVVLCGAVQITRSKPGKC
jgi:hypothetical protein